MLINMTTLIRKRLETEKNDELSSQGSHRTSWNGAKNAPVGVVRPLCLAHHRHLKANDCSTFTLSLLNRIFHIFLLILANHLKVKNSRLFPVSLLTLRCRNRQVTKKNRGLTDSI